MSRKPHGNQIVLVVAKRPVGPLMGPLLWTYPLRVGGFGEGPLHGSAV